MSTAIIWATGIQKLFWKLLCLSSNESKICFPIGFPSLENNTNVSDFANFLETAHLKNQDGMVIVYLNLDDKGKKYITGISLTLL